MSALMEMWGLRWDNEFKLSDIISTAALAFALLALFLTAIQIRKSTKTRRADLLLRMFENYFGNFEIRRTFYRLDYGDWKFDERAAGQSSEEVHIDYMLYFFDTLGHMLRHNEITKEEARIFGFQAYQVLRNTEVIKYIDWKRPHFWQRLRQEPHVDAYYLRDQIARPGNQTARPRRNR